MDPHDNPYNPGAGTKPPALVGRDGEISNFDVALSRLSKGRAARSFIFDGLRGVGKTVLLEEFDILAREKGWISSGVVECNEGDSLMPTIGRLSHRALRKLSVGKRLSAQAERALGALKSFQLTMDEGGAWRLNIDAEAIRGVADSGDAEADLVELLVEVGAAAANAGAGALFVLDEMQFLERDDLATLATVWHQLSKQNHPVLLAGAGLPQLPLMLTEAKPYAERLFSYTTIENLPKASAAAALTVPARRLKVSYDNDALAQILAESGGYPYFLQQWGEVVWNEAAGDNRITLADVESAAVLVKDALDARFFRDRYDRATEAERIYMAAMADMGDGRHSSSAIAKHMGVEQRAVSVRRASLLKKGLIYNPVDTALDFTVPQFADYMRRVHTFSKEQKPRRGRPPKGS